MTRQTIRSRELDAITTAQAAANAAAAAAGELSFVLRSPFASTIEGVQNSIGVARAEIRDAERLAEAAHSIIESLPEASLDKTLVEAGE